MMLVIVLVGIAGLTDLHAENDAVFGYPVGPGESEDVEKQLAQFASFPVSSGRFKQVKHIQRLSRDFNTSGSFLFSETNGIIWEIETPFPATMIFDETGIRQQLPNGTTTVMDGANNPVFERFSLAILAIFAGNYPELRNNFNVYYTTNRNEGRIGLIPKDQTVRLIIDSLVITGADKLESLTLNESSGDAVVYTFDTLDQRNELTTDEKTRFER